MVGDPTSGQDVILPNEQLSVLEGLDPIADQEILLYDPRSGRGQSNAEVNDAVVLMAEGLAQGGRTFQIIDDFNDCSISGYNPGDDGDSLDYFTASSERVFEGDCALKATPPSQSKFIWNADPRVSGDRGQILDMRVWHETDHSEIGMVFAVNDGSNNEWYNAELKIDSANERLAIFQDPGGNLVAETPISRENVPLKQWCRYRLVWDDGTLGGADGDITFEIYDEAGNQFASTFGNDTTYSSGGIGFNSDTGDAYVDYFRRLQ